MAIGGLFSKKKDSKDQKATQEVKAATSNPAPKPDLSTQQPQTQPDNFVNPFQQNQQPQGGGFNPTAVPGPNEMGQSQPEDLFNSPQPQAPAIDSSALSPGMQAPLPVDRDDIQEMVDEVVEKIIEEKWEKVVKNVEKVVSWKEKMEDDLVLMKEDIGMIKTSFEKLEKKLVGKLSDYDRDILDVSSEIKALEKVFQKITPTLVNNINELSKITSDLKGDTKSETSSPSKSPKNT